MRISRPCRPRAEGGAALGLAEQVQVVVQDRVVAEAEGAGEVAGAAGRERRAQRGVFAACCAGGAGRCAA
jgi:hypothetical protein